MAGVQHVLGLVEGTKDLLVDGFELVKDGIDFGDIQQLFKVLNDVKVLADNFPEVLPELQDLDAQEAGQVTEAAYSAVKAIIEALKK